MTTPLDPPMAIGTQVRKVRVPACGPALAWGTLLGLAVTVGSASSLAAETHGAMMVSAYVMPEAHLHIAGALPPLQISAADVAAGYVDAPRPLLLRVESNSRAGFSMDVSTLSPWCAGVALEGFDGEVVLDGAGGTVVQRWSASRARSLSLRARFKLAANVQPGLYEWPLQFFARPL
jgi:hypothetical protein